MKKQITVKYKGTNALSLLGVAFIVLKLTGYITWKWIWVLCPFWIGFAGFLLFLTPALILAWIFRH